MISKEFFDQLEIIAAERKLDINDVLEKVILALKKACAFDGFTGNIDIEFNNEKRRIRAIEYKTVVEEIDPEGEPGQILLEEALKIKDKVKIGTVLRHEINLENEIGRKGASQFKQLFQQGLKELSRKRSYEFFKERENEMIIAKILKITEEAVVLGIGMEYEAYMPLKEALPGEKLTVGDETRVYITKVEETGRGPKVYVSRAHRDIVKRLFEKIIPEVSNGVVEIMGVSRDPGLRTKVGVISNNPSVDPKGSCVGIQGVRIKQINNALNGERIDIFHWSDNPVDLIAESLTPARVISVLIDDENRTATVIVPDNQFSLAIGKGGQNARLASQVTGWRIDIKDESNAYRLGLKFKPNVNNKN